AVLLPPELLDDHGQARQASHISRHSRSQWQLCGWDRASRRCYDSYKVAAGYNTTATWLQNADDAAALRIAIWPSATEIWTWNSGHTWKLPKACSWTQGRLGAQAGAWAPRVDGDMVPATEHQSSSCEEGHNNFGAKSPLAVLWTYSRTV
ncbi:hypothetical protein M440DRAFT_1340479, partial [Trichoderma longibrachiatum ATCC 18648]